MKIACMEGSYLQEFAPDDETLAVLPDVSLDTLAGLMLRDLRLPLDTLVLSVSRDGHTISSHGYTELRLGDHVTVLGTRKSLAEVMRRFGA